MELLTALLFALAVSSDGFMVGLAYGIKKIKIPILSLIVIALASASAVTVAMVCGKGLSLLLDPRLASKAGAIMIIAVGIFFFMQFCREKISHIACSEDDPLVSLNIKPLGIIIHILKEPSSADFDCSGEISLKEAFFLGIALAMDAFGAGIGLAMAGFDILLTAICVGMLKFILVNSGLMLGRVINGQRLQSYTSLVTGIILVLIGISEFM